MNAAAAFAVVLLVLAAAGALYQARGLAAGARKFPAPGKMIDVGDHRLHAVCEGSGAPTVVLESGIAASSLSWVRVLPDVAKFTHVCSYDRAGLGWSDRAATPRTLDRILVDLERLVARLDPESPYVLVGHSFGAFVCIAFAAAHRSRVRGLVLLDPPTEWTDLTPAQRRMLRGGAQLSRLGGVLAWLGIVRASLALLTGGVPAAPRHFVKIFGPRAARTLEHIVGEVRKLPPEVHPIVQSLWCQPKCFRSMAEHLEAMEATARSVSEIGMLDGVEIRVISSGDQPAEGVAAHRAIARMSTRGVHSIASRSGHWVHFDEPELVVAAIRSVVDFSEN